MSNACRKHSALKDKSVTVVLLDKAKINIPIKPKTRYGDILIKIRKHLKLSSSNIFGLAYKTEHGDYNFLDPLTKVWKFERLKSHSENTEQSNSTCHIYLRVQYYVEAGHHFRSDSDKLYYYLQLKENFLKYGFNYPDDRCFLLASYAIHSDAINWRAFDPREYFPAWVLKSYGTQFVRKHMPTIKPEKMSTCQAMSTYITELSCPSPYIYNMRLYKLQNCKNKNSNNVRIGICHEGLEIYEVDARGYLNFLNSCSWRQIQSVHTLKRKLTISINCKNLEFYTFSDDWCKELCNTIKCAQLVYLGIQTGSSIQQDQFTGLDGTGFREAYIYSDEHDLEWEFEQSVMGTLPRPIKDVTDSSDDISPSKGDPLCQMSTPSRCRFSIISTSSTMTSGIVSDRTCLSTEVSQEDLLSNTTRPSSCDSLLDSSEYYSSSSGRLATVQRAISEPSKNFEQLRFKVRRSPKSLPRRALSDETIDEHDYENIAVIRKTLGLNQAPMTGNAKRKLMPGAILTSRSADQLITNSSAVPALNRTDALYQADSSMHWPHHAASVSSPASSRSRYSLVSNSPSMEQLLLDYTPPPSYNEAHARQRHLVLAASRQVSQDSTHSHSSSLNQNSPVRTSTPILSKSARSTPSFSKQISESHEIRKGSSVKSEKRHLDNVRNNNCNCLKLSHPEIDKLRHEVNNDLVSLPMISALCNDKELQRSANQCTCDTLPHSPRPISWHCETNPVFSFPPSAVSDHPVAQACR